MNYVTRKEFLKAIETLTNITKIHNEQLKDIVAIIKELNKR